MSRTNYRDWPTRILDKELLTKVVQCSNKLGLSASSCVTTKDRDKNGTVLKQRSKHQKFHSKQNTNKEDSEGVTSSGGKTTTDKTNILSYEAVSENMASSSSSAQKSNFQSKKTYECTFCEVKFATIYKYNLHKKKEEHRILSGEVYSDILDKNKVGGPCPICGYYYSSHACIFRHLRRTLLLSGDKKCGFCLHTFKTEVNLTRHISFCHEGNSEEQKYEDNKSVLELVEKKGQLYQCKICLRSYKHKQLCIRHVEQCESSLKQPSLIIKRNRKFSEKSEKKNASEIMMKNGIEYEDVLYKSDDLFHCKFCSYTNTRRCRTLNHVFNLHEYCSSCKIPLYDIAAFSDHINAVHGGILESKYDVKDTKIECVSSECDIKTSSDEDDDMLYSLNTDGNNVTKTDQSKNLKVNLETKSLKSNIETKDPKLETKNPKMETKNLKSNIETKNQKMETKNPKVEIKSPKMETKTSKVKAKSPKVRTKRPTATKKISKMKSHLSSDQIKMFGRQTPNGSWECKLCSHARCLRDRNAFLRHLRLSHLLCTICFRKFKFNLVFKKHLFRKHNMNDNHLMVSLKRGKKKTVIKPSRNLKGTSKALRLSNHRLKCKTGAVVKTGLEEQCSQSTSAAESSQMSDSTDGSGSDVSGIIDSVSVPTTSDLAILNMIDTDKSLSVELVPMDVTNSLKLDKSSVTKNGASSSRPLPNKYKDIVQKPLLKDAKIRKGSSDKRIAIVDSEICEKSVHFKDTDSSENSDLEIDMEIKTLPKTQNVITEGQAPSLKYLSKKSKYTSGTNRTLSLQAKDILTTTMPFVVLNKLNNIDDMKAVKSNLNAFRNRSKNITAMPKVTGRKNSKPLIKTYINRTLDALQVDDPIKVLSTSDESSVRLEGSDRTTRTGAKETMELDINNSYNKVLKNSKSGLRHQKVDEVSENKSVDHDLGTASKKNDENQRVKSSKSMKVEDNVVICPESDLNTNTKNKLSLNIDKDVMSTVDEDVPYSHQKGKRGRGRPLKTKKSVDPLSEEAVAESIRMNDSSLSFVTSNDIYKSQESTSINKEQSNSTHVSAEKHISVTCESDTQDRCEVDSDTTQEISTLQKTIMEDQIGKRSHQKAKRSKRHPPKASNKIQNAEYNEANNSLPIDVISEEVCNKNEDIDKRGNIEKDSTSSCNNDTAELFEEEEFLNRKSGNIEVKDVNENVKVKDIKEVKLVSAQNLQKYGYEMFVQKLPVVTLTRIHKSSSVESIENLSNQLKKSDKVLMSAYSLRKISKADRKDIVDEKDDADKTEGIGENRIIKMNNAKNTQNIGMSQSVESEDEGLCTEDEVDGTLISELGMHEVNEEFLDSSLSSMNDELFNEMPFLDESILNAEFEMIDDLSSDVSVLNQIVIEEKNGSWDTIHKSCPSQKTLALGLISCLQMTGATRTNGFTDLVEDVSQFESENVKMSGSLTDCSDLDMIEKDNNDNYEISDDLNKNLKELQASVLLVRKTKKHAKLKSLKKVYDKRLTNKKYSNSLTKTSCTNSTEIDNELIPGDCEKVQNSKGELVQETVTEKQVTGETMDVSMETELTKDVKEKIDDKGNDETIVLELVNTLNTVMDNSLVKVGTPCVTADSVASSVQNIDNAGDAKRSSTFACNWCKKSYKNKHSLQKHKRKKHSSQISPEKGTHVIEKLDKIESDSIVHASSEKDGSIIQRSEERNIQITKSSVTGDIQQKATSGDRKTKISHNEGIVATFVSLADQTKDSIPMTSDKAGKADKTEIEIPSIATSSQPMTVSSVVDSEIKLSTTLTAKDEELYPEMSANKSSVVDKASSGIYHVCTICGLQYRALDNLRIHLKTCHNRSTEDGTVKKIPDTDTLSLESGLVKKTETSCKLTRNNEVHLNNSEKINSGNSTLEKCDEVCQEERDCLNNIKVDNLVDLDLKNMVVDIERANFQVSMETDLAQTESLIDKITGESKDMGLDGSVLMEQSQLAETSEKNEIVCISTRNIDTVDSSEVQVRHDETAPIERKKFWETNEEKLRNFNSSNKSPFKNKTFPVKIKFEKSLKGKKKLHSIEKSDQNTCDVKKKRGRPHKNKDITLDVKSLSEDKISGEMKVSKEGSYFIENKDLPDPNKNQNLKMDNNQSEINPTTSDDSLYVRETSFEKVMNKNAEEVFEKVNKINSSVVVSEIFERGLNLQNTTMSSSKNAVNYQSPNQTNSPNVSPSKNRVNFQSPNQTNCPNVSPSKNRVNYQSPNQTNSPNVSPSKNRVNYQSPNPTNSPNVSPSKNRLSPNQIKSPNVSPTKNCFNSQNQNSKNSVNLNVKGASTFEDSYVSFLKAASNVPPELPHSNMPVMDSKDIARSPNTDHVAEANDSRENSNLERGGKHTKKCSDIEKLEITTDCSDVKEQNNEMEFLDLEKTQISITSKHQENDNYAKDQSPIESSVSVGTPSESSVEVEVTSLDTTILEKDNLLYKIDSELGNKTMSKDKIHEEESNSTDSVIDIGEDVLDCNGEEIIELNNMVTSVHLVRLPENKKVFKFGSTKLKRKRRTNGIVWKILNGPNHLIEKIVQESVSLPEQESCIMTELDQVNNDTGEFRTDVSGNNMELEPKASCKTIKKKLPVCEKDNTQKEIGPCSSDKGQLNEFEMALEASMKIGKKKTKKKKRLEKQVSVDSTEDKQESVKPSDLTKLTKSTEQNEQLSQKSVKPLGTGVTSKIVRKILRDKELEKEKNSEINLFDPSDIKTFEETIAKTDAKNKSEGEVNKKSKKSDTGKDNNDVLKSLYGGGSDRKILKSFRKMSNNGKVETEYRRRSPLDYGDFSGESSGLKYRVTNDVLDLPVSSPQTFGGSETGEDNQKTNEGNELIDGGGQKKKDLLKLMEGLIEDIDSAKKNRNEMRFGSERRVRFRETEESSDVEVGRIGLIAGELSKNSDFFHKFHGFGSKPTSPLKTPFSSPFLKRNATEEINSVERSFKVSRLAVSQQTTEKSSSEKTKSILNFSDNIRVEVGIGANNKTKRKVNFSLETDENKNDGENTESTVEEGEITEKDEEETFTLNEDIDMTDSWQKDNDEDLGCMEGVDTTDCWQQEIEKSKDKGANLELESDEELDFEEEIENDRESKHNKDFEDDRSGDSDSETVELNVEKQEVMGVENMTTQNTERPLLEGFQHTDGKYEQGPSHEHDEESHCNVNDNMDKDKELTRTNGDNNDNNVQDINDKIASNIENDEKDADQSSMKEVDSDSNSDIASTSVKKGCDYDSDDSSDVEKDEDAISFFVGDESLSVMEEEKQDSHDSDEDREKSEDECDAEEKSSSSDEEEREQEEAENKDSDNDDDNVQQNMETVSVCSTSHSIRSRRSVLSRRSGINDQDCIQLCVSDDEDASFLYDEGSDITSEDRCSPVDDEMTAEGEVDNVDMEIADDASMINTNIQVNEPPVTQNANNGLGNLTKQLVPWNHCFFFLTNRCTRKDCQFIHEKLNKDDIIRYWLNNLEKSLFKGNIKGIFESYKNVKMLNGQQPIPLERVTDLFDIALKRQDVDVVFKLCADMSSHKLLDSSYCNEIIKLCHKQPSMYADKLYHLFEIIKTNNGRPSHESLNILLSSFLDRSDWTKLWSVMQYCNNFEDYFPPIHVIQKACDMAIKQPSQYMEPMMKWLNECESSKLQELNPKLLQHIQSEVNAMMKKQVDNNETGKNRELPQKDMLVIANDLENQAEDDSISVEDYKHYRHRIHGCHITKNWDYLGSIFGELCYNTNSNNKDYLDAYVEALWDKKCPENLPSSLDDFITSVDKAYQIDKQDDVLAVLDEESLTLICSKLLYRIYDEKLWKVGHEVVSVICNKKIPCQTYSIPNRKNIIQVVIEICLNDGAPTDAFQIMLGTQWQLLETNIFTKNSREILKIFNQLLQQLVESKSLKESCTFLAALLTKADNDSRLAILNSEIDFMKAFNKIITEGLTNGNTQIAVTAYECYMNSSIKTPLSLALLRSLLASCGECGDRDKAMQLYERLRNMKVYEVQNVSSIPRYIVLTSVLTTVEIHYVISDYLNTYYNYLCQKQMDGNVLTYEDLKLAVLLRWYPKQPMNIPCLDKWTFKNPKQQWTSIMDILQNKLLTPLTGNLFLDQNRFEISPATLENYLKVKDQDCVRQGLHFVPLNQPRIPKTGGAGHWGRQGRRGRPYRRK